jgi:hypothetical protein
MDLKDKARAKEARRAAKKDEQRTTKGPEIAWDQPGGVVDAPVMQRPSAPAPAPSQTSPVSPTDSTIDETTDDTEQ